MIRKSSSPKRSKVSVVLALMLVILAITACGGNKDATDNNPAAATGVTSTIEPTRTATTLQTATNTPVPVSATPILADTPTQESALQDMIVGTWIEQPDANIMMAFSIDGRYFLDGEVVGTYEAISEHSIKVTYDANAEQSTEPFTITVLGVTPNEFVNQGAWFGTSETNTFWRVAGSPELEQEVLGYWRVDSSTVDTAETSNQNILFDMMAFNADGSFWSSSGGSGYGSKFDIFNDSMISVEGFDSIIFESIDGNTAKIRAAYFAPPVMYKRLREDATASKYLVGLWRLPSGELLEFTKDGLLISGSQGEFRVLDDGTVLIIDPRDGSGDYVELWQMVKESDDAAQLCLEPVVDIQNADCSTMTRVQ